VRDLVVRGERGNIAVQGVSLKLRQKEIFGLGGVTGNGQLELCEAMVGLRGSESGDVLVQGGRCAMPLREPFWTGGCLYSRGPQGNGLVPLHEHPGECGAPQVLEETFRTGSVVHRLGSGGGVHGTSRGALRRDHAGSRHPHTRSFRRQLAETHACPGTERQPEGDHRGPAYRGLDVGPRNMFGSAFSSSGTAERRSFSCPRTWRSCSR
jgi:energy-coupling factor transporter ATP-binding protein EcfA2